MLKQEDQKIKKLFVTKKFRQTTIFCFSLKTLGMQINGFVRNFNISLFVRPRLLTILCFCNDKASLLRVDLNE